jgi:tRNA threonylcarbamoyladenosine biosynthesis protein TsaB
MLSEKAYLAFDTSTEIASFALEYGHKVYTATQPGVATHAEKCLSHIDSLLQKANLAIGDLSGIIIGRGPGSFTGLRVACAVAKGLAFVHNIPIFAISNLRLLAWQASQIYPNSPILSVMDARMQQVYWAYYPEVFAEVSEYVTAIEDISLPEYSNGILAGFNIQALGENRPKIMTHFKIIDVKPEALSMIKMVETGHIQAIQAEALEPTYVRDQVTHGGSNG